MDGAGSVGSAHPASPPSAAPADAASSARRVSMTRFFPAPEIAHRMLRGGSGVEKREVEALLEREVDGMTYALSITS